jgi:hypothetical protein
VRRALGFLGIVLACLIAGGVGGITVAAFIPALRDGCTKGALCVLLKAWPLYTEASLDGVSAVTNTDNACLGKNSRRKVFALGLVLVDRLDMLKNIPVDLEPAGIAECAPLDDYLQSVCKKLAGQISSAKGCAVITTITK